MILLVDLCYREGSLGYEEFVLPVARIVEKAGYAVRAVHYRAAPGTVPDDAAAVILCGTPLADTTFLSGLGNVSWLADVRVPVLGVCAGMELVCRVFGGTVGPGEEIGMTEVTVPAPDPLFAGRESFPAYELHTLACTDPGPLRVLAVSDRCIQAVRHPDKPVYGVMFHPEVRNEWVVERFLSLAGEKRINP
jgi:GMP synthase (glutamine-hydrolysing)